MKTTVVYARSHSVGGVWIRWHDNVAPGRWSHVGVVVGDQVIESRAFSGVTVGPLAEFVSRYPKHEFVDYVVPNPSAGREWLVRQIGAGYDYLAIFGRMFRRSWQSEGRWHCQELVEGYLRAAGRQRFRDSPAHITPNLGYMVL